MTCVMLMEKNFSSFCRPAFVSHGLLYITVETRAWARATYSTEGSHLLGQLGSDVVGDGLEVEDNLGKPGTVVPCPGFDVFLLAVLVSAHHRGGGRERSRTHGSRARDGPLSRGEIFRSAASIEHLPLERRRLSVSLVTLRHDVGTLLLCQRRRGSCTER